MKKEILIALIDKDIKELYGFADILANSDKFSDNFLQLIINKSKVLTENLELLSAGLNQENEIEKQNQTDEPTNNVDIESIKNLINNEISASLEAYLNNFKSYIDNAVNLKIDDFYAKVTKTLEMSVKVESQRVEETVVKKDTIAEDEVLSAEENLQSTEEQPIEERQGDDEQSVKDVTPIETAEPEYHKPTIGDVNPDKQSLSDKFLSVSDNSLASKINNSKINDLKSAITIADRFRFQRELFNGDGEKTNRFIADFNSFSSMDEAKTYIEKHFNWSEENKAVADFLQLLERRYL